MGRLESLDWHRGLLALSIMVYHLVGWKLHQPDSSEILGRLGIYGVSMFFVLSGLSMGVVYSHFIRGWHSSFLFFVRRIFRIWPLLWIAVAAVTVGGVLMKGTQVDWPLVFLNLTTLFGFVSPGSYINTGAWSIGNEMVYYALTPVFILLYNKRILYGDLMVMATVVVGLYFAFAGYSTEDILANQWQTYINPLNNLFFYSTGIAIYYHFGHNPWSGKKTTLLMFLAVAIFCLYPVSGDLIHIVSGANRIVFYAASTGMVVAFYKLRLLAPRWISRPFTALGVATYGVYLLHPIIYSAVDGTLRRLNLDAYAYLTIGSTVILTIAAALIAFKGAEAPFIQFGKRITSAR